MRAKALGIRHLWFTEHDVRLGPRQYDIPYFRFDRESLTVEDAPGLCCGFTYLNDTPVDKGQTVCPDGRTGRLLSPDTSGEVGQDGFSGGGIEFFSDAKRHCAGLLSGVHITLRAFCRAADWRRARVIFDCTLSQQQPHFEQVHLLYVIGCADGLENDKTQVIPLPLEESGQYALSLSEDCAERIAGLDKVFCTVAVRVEHKNGAAVEAQLEEIGFSTDFRFEETRRRMEQLVQSWKSATVCGALWDRDQRRRAAQKLLWQPGAHYSL